MFGTSKWKQEIKDKEQELAECQSALAQSEQRLSKMSMMWLDAAQRISELERNRRELERQLKQVNSSVDGVSNECRHQSENSQKLLQQAGEMVERQEQLREEHEQMQGETEKVGAQEPISLAKIIAPITAELSNGMDEMRKMLEDVVEIGRQMGVLSLNAAVEAGRLGEGGRKFVEAAEEVRGMTEQYQQATSTLAQQMQIVGMKWQKSKSEIEEVEGRLKQQYAQLEETRNACASFGGEILNLPLAGLYSEMQKVLDNRLLEERCQNVSQKTEEAKEDFAQQQEAWGSLRQTVDEAKALIKDIQG